MIMVVEQLLNGLSYGLLLFLVAAGLSLVFGIMQVVNLAHGTLFMVGAFAAVLFVHLTGSFLAAVVLATGVAALLGLAIERLVITHLYRRDHLDQVLATFGLIVFANDAVRWLSGGLPQYVPPPSALNAATVLPGGIEYSAYRLAVIVAAGVVAGAMWLVIARTRTGMLVRAAASNPAMVGHMGFDVRKVSSLVFAAGSALAGLAGVLIAPLISVEVGMGEQILILAFVIVVIGGLGSVRGTFLASMLVGVLDSLGRAYMPAVLAAFVSSRAAASFAPAFSATLVYILLAVVLVCRPQGLFAR